MRVKMNANYSYFVVFVFALTLRNVLSQHSLHDLNYVPESDVDYQEYQPLTKPSKNSPFANRQVKPKSPLITQSSTSTPVPILKQINRHNEDGSYTYGFETADGSFKIETKLASGEVIGKYGYVDDAGKLRVVEYGANRYGFQPAGDGIPIPPSPAVTITNDTDVDEDELVSPSTSSSATLPLFFKTFFSKTATPTGSTSKRHRKPFGKPIRNFSSDRKNRYPTPTTYYVGTRERPAFITAADINSLQYLIGAAGEGDLRQSASGQTKFADSKVGDAVDVTTSSSSVHDATIVGHQLSSSEEFQQLKSDLQAFKNTRKAHGRTKQKAQFWLIAPAVIEEPTQAPQQAFKRSSSYEMESGISILDELLKQYAGPNESPAINNFSFGTNGN